MTLNNSLAWPSLRFLGTTPIWRGVTVTDGCPQKSCFIFPSVELLQSSCPAINYISHTFCTGMGSYGQSCWMELALKWCVYLTNSVFFMCLLFIFWRLRGPREGSQFTRSPGSSATTWKSTYEPGRQVLFCDVYYCVTSLALGYWLVTKENSFLNTRTVVCGLNPLWKWALQAEETMDRAAFFPETSWLLGAACPSFIADTALASRRG